MSRHSEPITERQIAIAATRFIRAKLNVRELKDARAKTLTEHPCPLIAQKYPPCYRQPALRPDEWCDNCKANQPHHIAYRAAAVQKANALRNLQSVVVKSLAQKES